MIRVAIISLPGAYLSAVWGISDILNYANDAYGRRFEAEIVDMDRFIDSFDGFDYVILPPFRAGTNGSFAFAGFAALARALGSAADAGAIPVSVCAGAFILCATGIADGFQVATHWRLAEALAREYPAVRVRKELTLRDEGRFITAGGITSFQDLSVYLVKKHVSAEAALAVSRVFLINPENRNQLQYTALRLEATGGDPCVERAQRFFLERYRDPVGPADAARHCSVSERTLSRRFAAAGAGSPGDYLRGVRLEQARALLADTRLTLSALAPECGYLDVPSFCRLFRARFGVSPGEYRRKTADR